MIRSLTSPSIPDDLTPRARKVARDLVKLFRKRGIAHNICRDPFWSPQRYYEATNKTHQKNYEWFCMVLMFDEWLSLMPEIAEICNKHGCYIEYRNHYSAYVGVHGL